MTIFITIIVITITKHCHFLRVRLEKTHCPGRRLEHLRFQGVQRMLGVPGIDPDGVNGPWPNGPWGYFTNTVATFSHHTVFFFVDDIGSILWGCRVPECGYHLGYTTNQEYDVCGCLKLGDTPRVLL